MKKLLLVLLTGIICSCGDDITNNYVMGDQEQIFPEQDTTLHLVQFLRHSGSGKRDGYCGGGQIHSVTDDELNGNKYVIDGASISVILIGLQNELTHCLIKSLSVNGVELYQAHGLPSFNLTINNITEDIDVRVIWGQDDSVAVVETDTIFIGEAVSPIIRSGSWRDTSSSQVRLNCGEDADRIKSVDTDAYIEFSCSLNIDPNRGNTVKLKVIRTVESTPNGWVVWQSFDGEHATVNEISGPSEFGKTSTMFQVKVMPPSRGFVNIEMRIEDVDNTENYFIIPFLAIRSK